MKSKKPSLLRKSLRVFLFTIPGLLLLALLLPLVFRPQLVAFAKKQLNKQLNATVNFKNVNISLIRNFPRLDLKFVDLSIVGKDIFPGDTLLYSPATHIVANIKTLFRSDVKIYKIELNEPVIHAKVDSSGNTNYDIVKTSGTSTDTTTGDFTIELEKYSINNGTITYNDDLSRIYSGMKNFNHSGKGNFTDVKYLMTVDTQADSVYFKYGTITYLENATIDIPLELDIDNSKRHYIFKGDEFFINNVSLSAEGSIEEINDSTDKADITVRTKQSEFKNLLTLIPGVYREQINTLETSGKATIDGKVTGMITASRNPDFDFKIDVEDAYIKNPDFNEPIRNINVDASIVNTGGTNDATVISLKNGSAIIGNDPIQFSLGISRPVTLMMLDLSAKGKVQLEKLKQILKLDYMDLRGLLNADVSANGSLAAFENSDPNAIRASGFMSANNFYYKDNVTLPFHAENVNLKFNNKEAALDIKDANYNKTSFSAKGSVYNFFNFLFINAPLRAKFSATTPEVNLSNWNISPGTATASPSAVKPFIVPSDLLLDITVHADRLISDDVQLTDLDGKVLFADKKILFENVSGNGLGGKINVDGSYSSANDALHPDVTLHYKLTNLDVQQTFRLINTAKMLMPIAEYLSGTLTSELTATGKLGDNFHPIYSSLFGNGNLLLLNGLLQKFKPLEVIAERLDIDRLSNIATKEIRNRFSFENGMVSVLPFKFTLFGNYEFEIAGRHGFDNSLDYAIKLTLPKKELGNKGDQLLQSLLSKAGSIGLNIKPDEKVSFFIKLTGFLKTPNVDIQLFKTLTNEFEELKKQAEEQIKSKLDSTKEVLKDTLRNIKKDVIEGIKDKIFTKEDTSTKQPAKDTSNKKKEAIKSVIDIFNRKTKKDSLR